MNTILNLYSEKKGEIKKFLDLYYSDNFQLENALFWKKEFKNPIEIADIIGVFIDNNESYDINMWISLDQDFFINVSDSNANKIIRYLFERYPY